METLRKLSAFLMMGLLKMPNLFAQDEGTYIDNLNTQDSSYMQQDVLEGAGQASSSNSTIIIIIVAVVVIAVVAFLFLRKKKK